MKGAQRKQKGKKQEGRGIHDDATMTPPVYNPDSLVTHVRALMLEENDHLFDGLVDVDSGFQKHSEKMG